MVLKRGYKVASMDVREKSEGEREAPRRAILKALASAPVIVSLLPGRARAEYRNGVYFEGSCAVPPPHSSSDECTHEDPPGNSGG
jgi:hypothetical protein